MSLWRWLRGTVWPFLYAVGERFVDHEGWVLSGHLAYSGMLALIPFLIFATAVTGLVIGPAGGQQVLDQLFHTIPAHVAQTLEPVILDVTREPPSGLLTMAAFGALYAGSSGIEALRLGLDRAYDVEDYRHVALSWLISVGVVIVGFGLFMLLAVLFVFAPVLFRLLEIWTGTQISRVAELIRYVIGFAVLGTTMWGIHWVLPSRRMRGLRLWPGILASMAMWVVAASIFTLYLSYTPYYTLAYGTLAGVVIALLFMYLSGAIVLLGAEVNAILNQGELARRGARPAIPSRRQ